MSAYRQKRFFLFLPVLRRSFSLLAWSHWCENDFYSQANKIIFRRKILHYGSFWSWELLELGNGQLLGRLLFIHLIQWTFSEFRFNWCPDKSTIIYDFRDFKTMRQNLGKTPGFFLQKAFERSYSRVITGKNNGFPFLDILGYLKNTPKNPKFGNVRQVPIREFPTKFRATGQQIGTRWKGEQGELEKRED